LAALVVAMTIGAAALLVLDTDPIRPAAAHLAALADRGGGAAAIVNQTDVPIQPLKWRNIIIHSSASGVAIAQRCHFVIEADGQQLIRATDLWKQQADGKHTFVREYNADSIGICVRGDFSRTAPTREQFEALVSLTRSLQQRLDIYPNQVYLHSELDSRSHSPGAAFPIQALNARLLNR